LKEQVVEFKSTNDVGFFCYVSGWTRVVAKASFYGTNGAGYSTRG
jgi:hypothetical protein